MYTLHGPPGEAHWQSACSHTRAPLLCSDHRCQSPTNKLTARSARMTPTRAQCARRWPRTPRATQACACRSDRRRHHYPAHGKLSPVHVAGLTCTDGVRHQRRYIRPKREVHARCQRRLLSGPFWAEYRRIALLPLLPLPSLSQLRRSQSGKDARQVALGAMKALYTPTSCILPRAVYGCILPQAPTTGGLDLVLST